MYKKHPPAQSMGSIEYHPAQIHFSSSGNTEMLILLSLKKNNIQSGVLPLSLPHFLRLIRAKT